MSLLMPSMVPEFPALRATPAVASMDFDLSDIAVVSERTFETSCPVLHPTKYYRVCVRGLPRSDQTVHLRWVIRYGTDNANNYPILPIDFHKTVRMVERERARSAVTTANTATTGAFHGFMYFKQSLHAPVETRAFSKTFVPLFLQCYGYSSDGQLLFASRLSDGFIMRFPRDDGMTRQPTCVPSPSLIIMPDDTFILDPECDDCSETVTHRCEEELLHDSTHGDHITIAHVLAGLSHSPTDDTCYAEEPFTASV